MYNKFYHGGVILVIRNGKTPQNFSDISDISSIPDISEINKPKSKKNLKKRKNHDSARISRFAEYLFGRKYYILVLSFIFIMGLLIGAVLVKNPDKKEVSDLCSVIDNYFSGIPSINMTARIINNIALNLVFLFGIYMCGATVFSPFICSAFCLYKGLSGGFIIGVYIIGGATLFHLAVCGLNFILYLVMTIFFILACGESMSFSSFLFKSEDSFKSNLSFKNISVYSSRYLLFLILITLMTIVQTIMIPVVYSILS